MNIEQANTLCTTLILKYFEQANTQKEGTQKEGFLFSTDSKYSH